MKIYVLANTLLFKDIVRGDDVFFPRIVKHFKNENKIKVITTCSGKKLWKAFQIKAWQAVLFFVIGLLYSRSTERFFADIV